MMTKTERMIFALALINLGCLSAMEAGDGKKSVITVAAPHNCQPIAARCDSAGAIHLLCDSPEGPQYARSTDGGKTFSRAVPLVDRASQKPGLEFTSWDLAVGADGRVHVALGTNAWKLKLPKDQWGFYYARLDPGEESFTPVQNINHKPSEGFSLAADDRGNVSACWLSDRLYANVSHDNGTSFEPAVEIDASFNPCNCCTTACTYAADGRLAILYREETDNDRDMFLALWDQRRNQVTRRPVSSTPWKTDSCPMTYYSISATPEGFVAAWPTQDQIYFARLDRDGEALSPGEVKTPGASGMRTGLLSLANRDGDMLVAWKKDSQLGWQLYDERARPIGRPGSAKSSGNGAAGLVDNDGQFVLFR
jgi:hypothetical protein